MYDVRSEISSARVGRPWLQTARSFYTRHVLMSHKFANEGRILGRIWLRAPKSKLDTVHLKFTHCSTPCKSQCCASMLCLQENSVKPENILETAKALLESASDAPDASPETTEHGRKELANGAVLTLAAIIMVYVRAWKAADDIAWE